MVYYYYYLTLLQTRCYTHAQANLTVVQITNTTIKVHWSSRIESILGPTCHEHKAAPSSGNVLLKEESNAFTMVFLDLSSLQTNLYTRLRITDWQHWVFVIAQIALVLSNLDNTMFIFSIL